MPLLKSHQIAFIDDYYRDIFRCLQAVDEMIGSVVNYLREEGILNNTYVFYMSDNSVHFGEHRLAPEKRQPYETDIRTPFIVRGPGVSQNIINSEITMNIDLAYTFLKIAKTRVPDFLDGKSLLPLFSGATHEAWNRSFALAELYGGSGMMSKVYKNLYKREYWNNTYQAVRVLNSTAGGPWDLSASDLMYSEWCTGETEFYDITKDPYQLLNDFSKQPKELLKYMSSVVEALGTCKGEECNVIPIEGNHRRKKLKCHNPPGYPGYVVDLEHD